MVSLNLQCAGQMAAADSLILSLELAWARRERLEWSPV